MSSNYKSYDSNDTAWHPVKKQQANIWVNIGTERGVLAELTMGIGKPDEDGYYSDYVGFDMQSASEVDEVIAMLAEAKKLIVDYHTEYPDGLEPASPPDQGDCE